MLGEEAILFKLVVQNIFLDMGVEAGFCCDSGGGFWRDSGSDFSSDSSGGLSSVP